MRQLVRILGLVTTLLFAFCTSDRNPFADSSNARAVVLDKTSFHDGDSLYFYTTCTLYVAVLVPEQVSRFRVHADSSRWFSDDTVGPVTSEEYRFPVSFVDTGWKNITVTTDRKGGDLVVETVRLYVRSPLHVDTVTGLLEQDAVFRSGSGVGDSGVWYQWCYGDGKRLLATRVPWRYPELSRRLNVAGSLPARVYVSTDSSGDSCRSPADSFIINLTDGAGPEIFCVNDDVKGDTVRTGGGTLYFLVQVADAGIVDRVEIDNERVLPSGGTYSRAYHGLDSLPGGTCRVPVFAVDASGNQTLDTFVIEYRAGVAQRTHISVTNVRDSTRTSLDHFQIVGRVQDDLRSSVRVTASVSGVAMPDTQPLALSGGEGTFGLLVLLDTGRVNLVTVKALSDSGVPLDSATVSVLRSAGLVDAEPPLIMNVTADGSPAAEGPLVYVRASTSTIRAFVLDAGSGVARVSIGGQPAQQTVGKPYEWSDTVNPVRYDSVRTVDILAIDSAAVPNERHYQLLLQQNRVAQMPAGWVWPFRFFANTLFSRGFVVNDEEPGKVDVSLENSPTGMTCTKLAGSDQWTLAWAPTTADTGSYAVRVVLNDGREKNYLSWDFRVVRDSVLLVRFQTRVEDLPSVLEASRESLSVMLTVEPGKGTSPFHYRAGRSGNGQPLLDSVTTQRTCPLRWLPDSADVGLHHLVVTVTDSLGDADTLYRDLRVVPTNHDPCRLVFSLPAGTDTTATGEVDMRHAAGPLTLTFVIADSDDPHTDRWTRTIIRRNARSVDVLDTAATFTIVLDTVAQVVHDTLTVIVADQSGGRDTVVVRALYAFPKPRPAADWVWPVRFVGGASYSMPLTVVDQPGHAVSLTFAGAPAGLAFAPAGANRWSLTWRPAPADSGSHVVSVTLADAYQDTTIVWAFEVVADSSRLVHFAIGGTPLPAYIEVGHPLASSLALAPGTGLAPFRYTVQLADGRTLIDTSSASRSGIAFAWTPTTGDLGTHYLLSRVTDAYGDADSLYRRVQVVRANSLPCSLSLALPPGADTTATGALDLSLAVEPETLTFVIHDGDDPLTEHHTLYITRGNLTTVKTLDTATTFTMVVDTASRAGEDTIIAVLTDATGTSSTVVLRVFYRVRPPASFGAAKLAVELDSRRENVTTLNRNDTLYVNGWTSARSLFNLVPNPDAGGPPRYDTAAPFPLVRFTRRASNNLYVNTSRSIWPWMDSAFTVFVVARISQAAVDSNYTLVSCDDSYVNYVGLGVSHGTMGAFSETGASQSSFAVQANRWYVYCFSSAQGKQTGSLVVSPWLNGQAGTPLPLTTSLTGWHFMVGATERFVASNAWGGDVAEVLMYRGALADDQRRQVEQYLSAKYGIALML